MTESTAEGSYRLPAGRFTQELKAPKIIFKTRLEIVN